MTELVILLAILVGGFLFGGGIATGVWLARCFQDGFPKMHPDKTDASSASPQPVEYVAVEQGQPIHEPPVPHRPPPARTNGESRFRYGGTDDLSDSNAFYELQERLARQQANPYADQYEA